MPQTNTTLVPEHGVTQHSLQNGEILRALHGLPDIVALQYDPHGRQWYRVVVTYADGHGHAFTGFAWGYGGEGPRGLAKWAEENGVPLTGPQISGLRNTGEAGEIWRWYRP